MEGYIGEIRAWAPNFAPKGWAFCNGQLLSIAQNTALFSLLGTTYGGDGRTTFALPNLCGRVIVGAGPSPGLSNYELGQVGGQEQVTLGVQNLPPHTHGVTLSSATLPRGASVVESRGTREQTPDAALAQTQATGGGQPISVVQPYLGVNYIICMFGIFPSRS